MSDDGISSPFSVEVSHGAPKIHLCSSLRRNTVCMPPTLPGLPGQNAGATQAQKSSTESEPKRAAVHVEYQSKNHTCLLPVKPVVQ